MRHFLALTLAGLVAAGFAAPFGAGPGQDQAGRFASAYRIGPRDLLEIKVRQDPNLDAEVRVSGQGKISLAMLGEVDVDGLTAAEVEVKLAGLYSQWYIDIEVAVSIKEYQSKQVSVLGAVSRPGFVQLLGRLTLLEAITSAGGLTRDAGREIIVFRTFPDGTTSNLRISIDDLMIEGDPAANISLEAGDSVIAQVERSVVIYVYGQVRNPGALQVPQSKIPSLTQAIAQAGGFTERAAKRRVAITRTNEQGGEKTLTVNVARIQAGRLRDVPLEENDVIHVPETVF